jgi:hypothetical protein
MLVALLCAATAGSVVAQGTRLSLLSGLQSGAHLHLGLSVATPALTFPLLVGAFAASSPGLNVCGGPVLPSASGMALPVLPQWGANPSQPWSTESKWAFDIGTPSLPPGLSLYFQALALGTTACEISNGVVAIAQAPGPRQVVFGLFVGPASFRVDEIDPANGLVTSLAANQPLPAGFTRGSRSDDSRFAAIGLQGSGLVFDRVTGLHRTIVSPGSGRFLFRPGDNQHVWTLVRSQARCRCTGSGTWWDYDARLECYDAATGGLVAAYVLDDTGARASTAWRSLTPEWTFDSLGQRACFKAYDSSWNNGLVELLALPIPPPPLPALGAHGGAVLNPAGSASRNEILAIPGGPHVVVEAGGFGGVGGPAEQICVVDTSTGIAAGPFGGPNGQLRLLSRDGAGFLLPWPVAPDGEYFAAWDRVANQVVFIDGVTPLTPSVGLDIVRVVPTAQAAAVFGLRGGRAIVFDAAGEMHLLSSARPGGSDELVRAYPGMNCPPIHPYASVARFDLAAGEGLLLSVPGGVAVLDAGTMTWARLTGGTPCGFPGSMNWQQLF